MLKIKIFLNTLLIILLLQVNGSCTSLITKEIPQERNFQSIIFIGDTQRTKKLEFWREKNIGIAETMLQKVAAEKPLSVIHLGDMTSDGSSTDSWKDFYSDAKSLFDNKIPIYPALGNHDYFRSNRSALNNLTGYFNFFRDKTWYSVKVSYLHKVLGIIILNSNLSELTSKQNSEQVEWYNNELKTFQSDTTVSLVIVATHHPPYTNSKVVSDSKEVQESFVKQFMLTPKAKLFFSGHCHSYEHFEIDNKHFIVSGGGGGPRQALKTQPSENIHEDVYKGPSLRNFNYCELSFTDNGLLFEMIMLDESGKFSLGDSFVIDRGN